MFLSNFAHSFGEGLGERGESGPAWSLKPAVFDFDEILKRSLSKNFWSLWFDRGLRFLWKNGMKLNVCSEKLLKQN